MSDSHEQRWRDAQKTEKRVRVHLADSDSASVDFVQLLQRYRTQCEDLILEEFQFATNHQIENILWDVHGKTNSSFRSQLKYFRTSEGKRKLVEQRKTAKHFLDFIKASQRFYRGYIQRLASRFEGIRELDAVANRLTLSTLSIDEPTRVSDDLRPSILFSCHQTLIRLGDLSRWRETQLVLKDRNWGPAIGYYDLARRLYPQSGACHNQLAVIALVDENHLRATYHLYRAMAVGEPYPNALGNLKVEFEKVDESWRKGGLGKDKPSKNGFAPSRPLDGHWIRIHAQCYRGEESLEQNELETQVLDQLETDLTERSMDGYLTKIVLMNIAAEYLAGVRLQENSDSAEALRSFYCFQSLNLKTLYRLLKVLQPDLARPATSDNGPSLGRGDVTVVMRRVLPSLRDYSSWLIARAAILSVQTARGSLNLQLEDFWAMYADTLTLFASRFTILELPAINYLLEEDEETIGFKPFDNDHTKRRYYCNEIILQKPRWHDKGVERCHPTAEMLGRIRDLLIDGADLSCQEDVPIQFVNGSFIHEDRHSTLNSTDGAEITHVDETVLPGADSLMNDRSSHNASTSPPMDLDSERMVDDLVGLNEDHDSYHFNVSTTGIDPKTPTPFKHLPDETSYGSINSSAIRDFFGSGGMRPPPPAFSRALALPSIEKSPFAPRPEELPSLQNSIGNNKNKSPTHSNHNSLSNLIPFPEESPGNVHLDSSLPSSIPDPTNPDPYDLTYRNQMTTGIGGGVVNRPDPRAYQHFNEQQARADEDFTFVSAEAYSGSYLRLSGQSTDSATNLHTPPNGQGRNR